MRAGSRFVSIGFKFRMNIRRLLTFCFLSALCGKDSGLVSAKVYIFAGAEGGSGTVSCYFTFPGNKKFFCKDECRAEDILIETEAVAAQRGRYSIKYSDESSGGASLSVTISALTKADSGLYRCGVGTSSLPDSYTDLEFRIFDAAQVDGSAGFIRMDAEGETISYSCSHTVAGRTKFFCKGECKTEQDVLVETEENRAQSGRFSIEYNEGAMVGLQVTIAQVTRSDSGWYRCGYGRALSPHSYRDFPILVTEVQSSVSVRGLFAPLLVSVSLFLVLLAAFLLFLYRRRKEQRRNIRGESKGSNMEASVTYENCSPVSSSEGPVYLSLHPATRDPNQSYSTLTHT